MLLQCSLIRRRQRTVLRETKKKEGIKLIELDSFTKYAKISPVKEKLRYK